MDEEGFIVDTNGLLIRSDFIEVLGKIISGKRHSPPGFMNKALEHLSLIKRLYNTKTLYSVDSARKEIKKTFGWIRYKDYTLHSETARTESDFSDSLERYSEEVCDIIKIIDACIYEWKDNNGIEKIIGRYAFHASKIHRPHMNNDDFGSVIETDRNIIASTIALATKGDITLLTNDGPLIASLKETLSLVIDGMDAREYFKHSIKVYRTHNNDQNPENINDKKMIVIYP